MKSVLLKIFWVLMLLTGLFMLFSTPDTDVEQMKAKYGGELAHYAENDGLTVHYRDQGVPSGDPIIFIHGSNASLHTWEAVVADLGDEYRLISLDLPGHGLTGPHPQDSYGIDGMFDGLQTVIDELGLSDRALVLVGNSMGGWVSWRYALENPERVKAMVLIDAGGAPSDDTAALNLGFRLMLNPLTRPFTKYFMPRWVIKKSILQTVYDSDAVSEETIDRYWELNRFPGNRHATTLRALLSRKEQSIGTRISEISMPTLILWGSEDQIIKVSSAHIFNDMLKNAKMIIYPEIGHIPMEENPGRVANDIRNFISGLTPESEN